MRPYIRRLREPKLNKKYLIEPVIVEAEVKSIREDRPVKQRHNPHKHRE